MASPFTTYKLIILYMLQNSDGDLTNSQITDFILDRKYTNYFQLQQAVSELVEADLVEMSSQSNRSYYRLTSEGKNILVFIRPAFTYRLCSSKIWHIDAEINDADAAFDDPQTY